MKTPLLLLALVFSSPLFAQQHGAIPHGMVYGVKPDTTGTINAAKVEDFMDKKTRISITIRGKVLRVTKRKGGWFDVDAGKGKVIAAHFKNYNVSIPLELKGRIIVADGVAQKQFIADDQQHFAGNARKPDTKINPKKRLTFEVLGLMTE